MLGIVDVREKKRENPTLNYEQLREDDNKNREEDTPTLNYEQLKEQLNYCKQSSKLYCYT